STTSILAASTTKSFPAHCLLSTVGAPLSGPFDHTTCRSSLSPSSPTNLPGTNSSARSKIRGSRVANGWNPYSISPSLTSYAASCDSTTRSRRARPYCDGTGGSIRSASYTTDFTSGIPSMAAIVTGPGPGPTADRTSSARRAWTPAPARPIHFIMLGNRIFIPPKELKHVVKTKLWQASSRPIPSFSACSRTAVEFWREGERVKEAVLNQTREAQNQKGVEVEQHPLAHQLRPVRPEDAHARALEELRVAGAELRHHVLPAVGEEEEDELLQLGVVGLGGVEEGDGAVAAGELRRGHVGAGEEIPLLDLVGVEECREAFTVEQNDDVGVEGDEGSRRHVCAEDGGVVFFYSGFEEFFPALVVEEILPGPMMGRPQSPGILRRGSLEEFGGGSGGGAVLCDFSDRAAVVIGRVLSPMKDFEGRCNFEGDVREENLRCRDDGEDDEAAIVVVLMMKRIGGWV
ncbi:isocitrate dehydrogenase 1, partial [Striga asiatica]